ncbi:MAG: DUF423 domain-containing protein [Bacteroidota bacterium]
MKNSKLSLLTGAFFGLTAVILGAMGAHALEAVLNADQLDSFKTGVRYQMYHAFLLLLLGWIQTGFSESAYKWIVGLLIAGVLMFSGSIYLLVLTPIKVGIVTPIGGTLLIIAWTLLLIQFIRKA